ncbi:MAG: hypothetical protein K2N36_08315, partial [Ruminiclostridium sp.]|nr:hypothetical protein [Ruminiclostridium sp.]
GFNSFKDYLDFALSDKTGNETIQLVNKLTTNHTFFLREPEHFTFLKNTILPYIEKANLDHTMNLWCAASSKGHEPYTILFTVLDYFGPNISKWRINYIATDIDTEVLNYARAGVYPATELKDVPQGWITKYFRKVDEGNFAVRDNYRMMIQFKQFNLMDKIVTQKPYDFISCRNVMIYFDMETKNALVERFYDATKEGGYLFTGHSESVSRDTRYTYIQPAIYRKQSGNSSNTSDPKLGLTKPAGAGTIGAGGLSGTKSTIGNGLSGTKSTIGSSGTKSTFGTSGAKSTFGSSGAIGTKSTIGSNGSIGSKSTLGTSSTKSAIGSTGTKPASGLTGSKGIPPKKT